MTECPRWRLLAAHYLNVPTYPDGTRVEYEHKETNALNGRAVRKLFSVPLLLNPDDPNDYNYPGEIIVTQQVDDGHCLAPDIVFLGAPTRDMEPLNAEAEVISNQHRARWVNPIETLPANGGMDDKEMAFMQNMMKAFAGQVGPTNTSVPQSDFDALKAELESIKALLAKPADGATSSVRRA
jgi:hypothetical protein